MNSLIVKWRPVLTKLVFATLLSVASLCGYSQSPTDTLPGDPGAITIYTVQNMSFGAFSPGTLGGTIVVSNAGSRSVTGDVIGLNFGILYFQAIFDIDAPQGSIISILNGPNATLTGSNGGTMSVKIGNSAPASPFSTVVAQPLRTQVNVGGTLTVGTAAACPPGTYSGTIYLTFNQE
jgi:hypothetical protein